MPDKGLILVCDDNGDRAGGWADSIRAIEEVAERFEVRPMPVELFASGFEALRDRRLVARSSGRPPNEAAAAEVFDEADIVIVDFDLTPTDMNVTTGVGVVDDSDLGAPATEEPDWVRELSGNFGNVFAYLVRCYSAASFTVLVNQDFPVSTFDLTMRRFDFSMADLNVAERDLLNPALWTGTPRAGEPPAFRPWHWPRLLDAPGRHEALADLVDLDGDVFEALGLTGEGTYELLHTEQLEVLGVKERGRRPLTFRDMARATRFGILDGDAPSDDRQLCKIAATAVTHWLERFVLPGQNVFVDAPHLAQRQPGLVKLDPGDWDALADLADPDGVCASVDVDQFGDPTPTAAAWTSRPVWNWVAVPRNTAGFDVEAPVFCEDISRFRPIDDATEFNSSVPGPLKQRFVAEVVSDGTELSVAYDPALRLL